MADDILYPGALVPGSFGFLGLRRDPRSKHLVLATLPDGELMTVRDRDRDTHMYVCGATGRGKTRFLASLLLQDLYFGRPVCVLDPGGQLYDYARSYVARCRRHLLRKDPPLPLEEVDRIVSRYLFLNIADKRNPIRLNPLEVQPPETADETLEDLMRAVERFMGQEFKELRKVREVLRAAFRVAIELNELPQDRRPKLPFGCEYPLDLSFVYRFIEPSDDRAKERKQVVSALMGTVDNDTTREFALEVLPGMTRQQLNEEMGSSRRVLLFFIDIGNVGKHFFRTRESTLDVDRLLREGMSLFANLREGTTSEGVGLVGTFLANKLERVVNRRRDRSGIESSVPCTLYMDEFQRFCDRDLAEDFTQLRKEGLRMVCAHQNTLQQPFDDDKGRSMLTTIVGMSGIRVVFGVDSKSADRLVDEVLPVTHQVAIRREAETRTTRGTSHASTDGSADTRSESHADASQESVSFGRTDSSTFSFPLMGAVPDRSTHGGSSSYQNGSARSRTDTRGTSHQKSRSATRTHQQSETFVERTVYASGLEERELNREQLQLLRDQECFIGTRGPNAIKARVVFVPDARALCPSSSLDLVELLMENQRQRIKLPELPVPLASRDPVTAQVEIASVQLKLPLGDGEPDNRSPEPVSAATGSHDNEPGGGGSEVGASQATASEKVDDDTFGP